MFSFILDEYIELDDLHGSRSISIMAAVDSSSSSLSNDLVKFMSCAEGEDCPLDLILELMVRREGGERGRGRREKHHLYAYVQLCELTLSIPSYAFPINHRPYQFDFRL